MNGATLIAQESTFLIQIQLFFFKNGMPEYNSALFVYIFNFRFLFNDEIIEMFNRMRNKMLT